MVSFLIDSMETGQVIFGRLPSFGHPGCQHCSRAHEASAIGAFYHLFPVSPVLGQLHIVRASGADQIFSVP
jgi:hypothetical protein